MFNQIRLNLAKTFYPEIFMQVKKEKVLNKLSDEISSFRIIGTYNAPAGNIKHLKTNAFKYMKTLKQNIVLPYTDTYLCFLKKYNYKKEDCGIKRFNNLMKMYCLLNKLEYVSGKHRINGKVDSYSIIRGKL